MIKNILIILLFPVLAHAQLSFGDFKQYSADFNLRDRVPNNKNETGVIYDSGNTYCFTSRPWDAKNHEYGAVLPYNDTAKWYPAAIDAHTWRDNADNHPTTVGVRMKNGQILLGGEMDHGQDYEFWISKRWPQDYQLIDRLTYNLSRGSMWPYGDTSAVSVMQESGISLGVSFYCPSCKPKPKMTPFRFFMTPVQTGKRVYCTRPTGKDKTSDGYYVLVLNISTSQGHEEYGLFKTKDFITFYSWDLSQSYSSATTLLTESIIRDNKVKFFGRKNAVPSLPNCIQALSDDDKFYSVAIDELTGQQLLITVDSTGNFVQKLITFPVTPLPLSAGIPDGGSLHWMYVKDGIIYVAILTQESVYRKWHMVYSTDMGNTWVDQGDVFPNVNENFHKFGGPVNYIPGGAKFAFFACKQVYMGNDASGLPGTVYSKEAWFGVSVKAKQGIIAPPDALNWKFKYDGIGNTAGVLVDDSGNGYNATGTFTVSNGWVSSTTGLTMPNVFENDSSATLIFKAIRQSATSKSAAWGTTANAYKYLEIELSDKITWRQSQTSSVTGQGRIYSVNNTINVGDTVVVAVVGNKYHLRFWINGVECNKVWDTDSSPQKTWRWIAYLKNYLAAPANTAMIGARKNTGVTATPIKFSFIGYISKQINPEAISKQLMGK